MQTHTAGAVNAIEDAELEVGVNTRPFTRTAATEPPTNCEPDRVMLAGTIQCNESFTPRMEIRRRSKKTNKYGNAPI
jgi:hypothetical protein